MVFATDKFKKQYQVLSQNDKDNIHQIVDVLKSLPTKDYSEYLVSMCGENGNAKWSGINKNLYHLYPKGQKSVHRLFYCYATDLDNDIREKAQIMDGIVFIDYTTNHDDEKRAARNYEKSVIKYLTRFEPHKYDISSNMSSKVPVFWFCMSSQQEDVLSLPQPTLIKGSAGTGKTIISYELLKQWIVYDNDKKFLYLTYTDNLLEKTKKILSEDGLDINNGDITITNFMNLYSSDFGKQIVTEQKSRAIIIEIIEAYKKNNTLTENILFTDYFVYAYIRGLMKGRVVATYDEFFDHTSASIYLDKALLSSNLNIREKSKLKRQLFDHLNENSLDMKNFNNKVLSDIIGIYDTKKDRDILSTKIREICSDQLFNNLNTFRIKKFKYNFIEESKIVSELHKDSIDESDIKILLEIRKKYDKVLNEHNLYDDNDYAKYLLNQKISENDKFDGIIVDEVQDLTESQIEAIVKLSKSNSNQISFFGDPNQTINPTVYDYGRFNSYVYKEKNEINRMNLKVTHRCGPNLLDYINHLTRLRQTLKLTTNREDVEPEVSANKHKIDTYWACLVEDTETIDHVLEIFPNAIDCYLIVDSETTKQQVIERIKRVTIDSYDKELMDQIITVQNAKGLESKNVIIYNLISDNLEIFDNLNTHNNKISAMTFNKFYVSVTRAEDSIIICEERINENIEVKKQLFYSNNNLIVEKVSHDDIHDYLVSSSDPEKFLEQAQNLLEEDEYEKARKKSYIAIKKVVNQFRDYDQFEQIIAEISKNDELSKIFNVYNPRSTDEINYFIILYDKILKLLSEEFSIFEFKLLQYRREMLDEAIRIRDICQTIFDYEILKNDLLDIDIQNDYIEKFILLKNYRCAFIVASDIKREPLKKAIISIVKYLFGYLQYDETMDSFKVVEFSNTKFYKWILDNNVIKDSKVVLEKIKGSLGGIIND